MSASVVLACARAGHTEANVRGSLLHRRALDAQYDNQMGMQSGFRHGFQATSPQTGQLHLRKYVLHSTNSLGVGAAPVMDWAYLIHSLRAGVEASIPETTFVKLIRGEELSNKESSQLRDGQRLFLYELDRRIGLLEDCLADAQLKHLVSWPLIFQRAWVRLPLAAITSSPGEGSIVPSSTGAVALVGQCGDGVQQQQQRVVELTRLIVEWVEEELGSSSTTDEEQQPERKPKSQRKLDAEMELRRKWEECFRWHRELQHL